MVAELQKCGWRKLLGTGFAHLCKNSSKDLTVVSVNADIKVCKIPLLGILIYRFNFQVLAVSFGAGLVKCLEQR